MYFIKDEFDRPDPEVAPSLPPKLRKPAYWGRLSCIMTMAWLSLKIEIRFPMPSEGLQRGLIWS